MVYHVRKNFNKDKEPFAPAPAPVVKSVVKSVEENIPVAQKVEHVQMEPPRKLGNVRFEAPQMMRAEIQEAERKTTIDLTNYITIISIVIIILLIAGCIWLYTKNKSGAPPTFYYF